MTTPTSRNRHRKVPISAMVDTDLMDLLEAASSGPDRSISSVVRDALRQHLQADEEAKEGHEINSEPLVDVYDPDGVNGVLEDSQ